MPYRLIIDWPSGSQSQGSLDPLVSREAVGMCALRFLAGEGVRFGRDGIEFGRTVRDAPLGETVTHEPSGFRFTTKEF